MNEIQFSQTKSINCKDAQELVSNLVSFNDTKGPSENHEGLLIIARGYNNKMIGGLRGYTHFEWLFISHLWVDSVYESQGLGSKLMQQGEAVAIERGCNNSHVDTYSFQSLGFYLKKGYEVFGQLENYPPNFSRHFLSKKLTSK